MKSFVEQDQENLPVNANLIMYDEDDEDENGETLDGTLTRLDSLHMSSPTPSPIRRSAPFLPIKRELSSKRQLFSDRCISLPVNPSKESFNLSKPPLFKSNSGSSSRNMSPLTPTPSLCQSPTSPAIVDFHFLHSGLTSDYPEPVFSSSSPSKSQFSPLQQQSTNSTNIASPNKKKTSPHLTKKRLPPAAIPNSVLASPTMQRRRLQRSFSTGGDIETAYMTAMAVEKQRANCAQADPEALANNKTAIPTHVMACSLLPRRNSIDDRPKMEEDSQPSKVRRTASYSNVSQAEPVQEFTIPVVASSECIKKITPQTMVRLLLGEFNQQFSEVHIIDCRFDYEYEGGHIKGAVNLNTKQCLENKFLANPVDDPKVCVIFHCEFSSQRGPKACQYLRQRDRELKKFLYPQLFYPDIYILEGGYKAFYNQYPEFCSPGQYIPMNDPLYAEECKRQTGLNQREWCDNKKKR